MTTRLPVLPIEHQLLSIARAAVGAIPPRAVAAILLRSANSEERASLEHGLSRGARRAFESTLARGATRALLTRGGWRRMVACEPDGPRTARLWDRAPTPLTFSMRSFELLRWLTVEPLDGRAPAIGLSANGDELLLYLVCDLFAELSLPLRRLAHLVEGSRLAQLAFPDALVGASNPRHPERVAELLEGSHGVLLSALQADLARQLERLERVKSKIIEPSDLETLGALQESRLSCLIEAASARERIDLLAFLVEACDPLSAVDGSRPALDPEARLADRQAARRSSAGVLRCAARVAELHRELQHVGFVDDDYDRAQALLNAWEPHAPALARAAEVARTWSGLG